MYKHKNGIILKKLTSDYLPLLASLKNESWFGTHQISFVNELDQQRWFESIDSSNSMFLLAEYDDHVVGLYKIQNLDWMNRQYDSAHDVFEASRGKGFSTRVLEAGVDFGFEVLNMNRLNTEVLENNLASMKSALKVGYVKEGIRRKAIYKCNEYLDSIVLGIIRNEWEQLERVKDYNGVCNKSYAPKNDKSL